MYPIIYNYGIFIIYIIILKKLGICKDRKIDPNKVVFNVSSRDLSRRETEILTPGLDFAISFQKFNSLKYFAHFEVICNT